MPVHLDWRQKLLIKKQAVISNHFHGLLPEKGRQMQKNISLEEFTEKGQNFETARRLRTYSNYQKFTAAVAGILSQIPKSERKEFADNGQVGGSVRYFLNYGVQGAKVHLIFEKGSTVISPNSMPDTKLKRVELANGDGKSAILWSKPLISFY